jgi:hypothetical protein
VIAEFSDGSRKGKERQTDYATQEKATASRKIHGPQGQIPSGAPAALV